MRISSSTGADSRSDGDEHAPAQPERQDASDGAVEQVVLAATRELLRIAGPEDARAVASELVKALGGRLTPAAQVGEDALPVDVSFGVGEPVLPAAPAVSLAHLHLARHLPAFVRDANRALELAERTSRLVEEAETDPLSGLATRRVLGRVLGRLTRGDVVVMLDLDHFKELNDTHGHIEGDRVLRAFGRAITDTVRARDLAGRYGGEEFLIVLPGSEPAPPDPEALLARLRSTWERTRPQPVSFSAGIARVEGEVDDVMRVVDVALYAAKTAGRDRWAWAEAGSRPTTTTDRATQVVERPSTGGFVAHSRLSVPEGGRDELVSAFDERLRLVERWPGFKHLEVWADRQDPTEFVMVSWWNREEDFRAYMASEDHRRSHARIPGGELRPRPETFHRFEIVAR